MIEKDFKIPIHPGRLLSGMLDDEGISQSELARALHISRKVISEICTGKRGISAEMAFKLGRALGQGPDFWMTAQMNWELANVERSVTKGIRRLVGSSAA